MPAATRGTIVADTGAVYALYDADDRHHSAVRRIVLEPRAPPVVVPEPILAEVDYLLRTHLGVAAELDFLDGVIGGAFALEPLAPRDLEHCRARIARYRDLDLGLADAAVMVMADRLGTGRILTLDERDFRAVTSERGDAYTLLPADLQER